MGLLTQTQPFFIIAAKCLVFSQYASTLKWLQTELPNHGFQFRTLSGDMVSFVT